MSKLTNIFGRVVYNTIGKSINPTFYRQIIETEKIEKLDTCEQANLSKDQKHASAVAKIHYQKRKSEDIASESKEHNGTESSASNNALIGSNHNTKVGHFLLTA